MAQLKINANGLGSNAASDRDLLRAIAQDIAKLTITAPEAVLTDSSTGSATANAVVLVAPVVGAAASGSNLAGKTTAEAALITVKDALATLFVKANALATKLGVTNVTYNGGGTDGAGTVAAVTKVVTGATTGTPVDTTNVAIVGINKGFYALGCLVNELAIAVGDTKLLVNVAAADIAYLSTVPAISTATGTAVTPAATKAEVDAALVVFANNVASIAAAINTIVGPGVPKVLAQ